MLRLKKLCFLEAQAHKHIIRSFKNYYIKLNIKRLPITYYKKDSGIALRAKIMFAVIFILAKYLTSLKRLKRNSLKVV